jgi:hypothetical protein
MTTLAEEAEEQHEKSKWLPAEKVQEELGLSRYLFKRLRDKYQLGARSSIDRRFKLIDLNAAKRCLEKEVTG